jgi:hypothetical protein
MEVFKSVTGREIDWDVAVLSDLVEWDNNTISCIFAQMLNPKLENHNPEAWKEP